MERAASLPVVVLCLLIPAANALPAGLLGDAGSGADAGGTPETAMPLAYGGHHGNMTPGDSDWFVFPASSAPACMRTSVSATHAMAVEVGAGEGVALEGGLTDGLFETTVAVEPLPTQLGLMPDEAPWDLVSVGPYSFTMNVALPTAVGDDRYNDAPPDLATAPPAPADCFAAHFKDDAPDRDVWSFAANAGDLLTYSIAIGPNAIGILTIRDAGNQVLGEAVYSGEAAQLVIPETSTYYLHAKSLWSSGDERYAVAAVAGPEPTGCRPYCFGMDLRS